jgi:hypothetical protein
MAERMAPVPRIGFECRLADPEPRLDVQQCIRRDDGEPAQLREFILTTQPTASRGDDAWARLARFCEAWTDPGSRLHRGIFEIFLEYDLDTTPQPALSPSVFFSVGDADTPPAEGAALVDAALALLLPSRPDGLSANLERCFAACPSGASVSYVGAMLGRSADAVRLNVKRVRPADLLGYLHAIDWTGSVAGFERWAAWAWDRFDRVTLCLDVGVRVYPHVGLECALAMQPSLEPRWEANLQELTGAGLATADNAAALLTVPGVLVPPDCATAWPPAWVAATLSGAPDRFSSTERQLSHLKLTVSEEHAVLKGYWGAGHVWRTPARQAEPTPTRRSGLKAVGEGEAAALAGAVEFLLLHQAQTGRWSDFVLPAGPSDEWVTAFVATSLLETGAHAALDPARRAWAALLRRRPEEPGWGYNRLTPADADSTAWALRLASALAVENLERVVAAGHFLTRHVREGGGVTTYAERDPIHRYTRLPDDASMAGWQAAHACVTAAAAPAAGQPALDYLSGEQTADGHWEGYWWWDDEYTTALAAEALAPARERAVAWALTRVRASGAVESTDGKSSPWATAWCVRILRLASTPAARAACDAAVRWLVETQRADGSWRSSARLRVPMPAHLDPSGHDKRIEALDQHRVFTTAAVAAALGARVAAGCPSR